MSSQAPNSQVRSAALLEHDTCARKLARLRRRQAVPHAIAAGLLALGVSADLIALLTQSPVLVTFATALLSIVTVVGAIAFRDKLPEQWRTRILAATLTGAAWLTLASGGLNWGLAFILLAADAGFGAKVWAQARNPAPAATPMPVADVPAKMTQPELDTLVTNFNRYVSGPNGALPGATLTRVGTTEHTTEYRGRFVPGGQTLESALHNLTRIASGLDLHDLSEIVLDRAPGQRLREFRLQHVTNSPIAGDVLFDRVRYRNGVVDLGPFGDGRGEAPYVHRTPGSAHSCVIIGETGSGKGRVMENIVINVMEDTTVWFLDPQGGSSSPALKKYADWYLDLADAEMLLEALQGFADERGQENAYEGFIGFDPTDERRSLLVVIDECHEVFRTTKIGDLWGNLAREIRKLGGHLLLLSQYNGLPTWGGSTPLRSSVMAGNAIALRNVDNSAQQLMPGLPVDPKTLPKIPGYGYTTAGAKGTRTAPFRNRLPVDAEALMASRPHHSLDVVAAYGVDQATGGAYSRRHQVAETAQVYRRERIEAIRAGKTPPPDPREVQQQAQQAAKVRVEQQAARTGTTPIRTSDNVLRFPTIGDYLPDTATTADEIELAPSEQRYLDIVDQLGGMPRMVDVQNAAGWSETNTRNWRDSLLNKGALERLGHGRYGRPGTPIPDDGGEQDEADAEESELAELEHATA